MLNLTRRPIELLKRDGISIIEVLTSMAVATIGVFGVMVMIPFAVNQSQKGLDKDAANALGRNAIEDMQINGFLRAGEQNVAGDVYDTLGRIVFQEYPIGSGSFTEYNCELLGTDFPFPPATPEFTFPGLVYFDPIGVASGLTSLDIADPSGDISITSATGTRLSAISAALPAGGPLTLREASRLCRSTDELFFENGEDLDDSAPPQPLYDFDAAGNQVKRQYSGRISWSVMLVPEKEPMAVHAPVNRFKAYSIVHRDREFIDEDFNGAVISNYGVYQTAPPVRGFEPTVNQITLSSNPLERLTGTDRVENEIRRDDWVMLVNRIPAPDPSSPDAPVNAGVRAANNGYRTQVMFARVKRVNPTSLIIEGGSFDFVPLGVGGSSETYMVHLKNVVNVFERSISIER